MCHGATETKVPSVLNSIIRIFLVLGSAWIIFNLFSDISMNILQRTEYEYISSFTPQYIVDIAVEFVFYLSLAFMMMISAVLGVGKTLSVFWVIEGAICTINIGYSVYKYLYFSVDFFKNYTFSFDGVFKIFEFLLYLSYVVSLALVCLYCGNLCRNKLKRITVVFSLLGMVYLFSAVILSLFNGGEFEYFEVIKSFSNMLAFGAFYIFGFINDTKVEKLPDNAQPLSVDLIEETEKETKPLNLEEITTIIESADEVLNDEFLNEHTEINEIYPSCVCDDAIVESFEGIHEDVIENLNDDVIIVNDVFDQIDQDEFDDFADEGFSADSSDLDDITKEISFTGLDEALKKIQETIVDFDEITLSSEFVE